MSGTYSLVCDEAANITGVDPDFQRRDLWESIEAGVFPSRTRMRLTVLSETPTLRAMYDWIIRRRNSTMSDAFAGSMASGEHCGREEASASAASPPDRNRPSHLRAVAGVTPCVPAAWPAEQPHSIICRTISTRRAHVNRAFLWLFTRLASWETGDLAIASLSEPARINTEYSLFLLHT